MVNESISHFSIARSSAQVSGFESIQLRVSVGLTLHVTLYFIKRPPRQFYSLVLRDRHKQLLVICGPDSRPW